MFCLTGRTEMRIGLLQESQIIKYMFIFDVFLRRLISCSNGALSLDFAISKLTQTAKYGSMQSRHLRSYMHPESSPLCLNTPHLLSVSLFDLENQVCFDLLETPRFAVSLISNFTSAQNCLCRIVLSFYPLISTDHVVKTSEILGLKDQGHLELLKTLHVAVILQFILLPLASFPLSKWLQQSVK